MKHHEIIQRRLQVREEWLARTLESFNEQVSDQTEVNIFFSVSGLDTNSGLLAIGL